MSSLHTGIPLAHPSLSRLKQLVDGHAVSERSRIGMHKDGALIVYSGRSYLLHPMQTVRAQQFLRADDPHTVPGKSRALRLGDLAARLRVSDSAPRQAALYAPFAAKDIVEQGLGRNLVREQRGKPLLPVIVRDDRTREQLQNLKDAKQQDLSAKSRLFSDSVDQLRRQYQLSEAQARQLIGPETFDKARKDAGILARQADVLRKMEILSNRDGAELGKLVPDRDKLYIIGHGGSGMDILAADAAVTQGRATAADVAAQLAAGGLSTDFRDIRVTACHSADSRDPLSFRPVDLSRAAKPVYGRKTGWLGLFGQRAVLSQPFAQTLSDALRKQGFHQPEVSGYHGAGVTYSAAGHHARRLPGGSAQADVRAADVRRVFTPARSSSRR
ncbi:hypothetical protein [Chromobacterium violaceum]|uniref:Peptidase C80 domain-containing protein n=1 Tax=Chromobacterium violaceum TaxID=536 RepID=A0A202BAW0_CHRVL|nr:hypothetical protein [Chromobacterium violaceum]MBA8734379.1 hypothetical protein [Chromobacterium violaceum]OVE48674.1 hypothetical protein CBW21_08950 [Chromobacterium violaceum]